MREFKQCPAGLFEVHEGNEKIAFAHLNQSKKYIDILWVSPNFRRQGIAIALVRFITENVGKLTRAPTKTKTSAVVSLSAKLGDELDPEKE